MSMSSGWGRYPRIEAEVFANQKIEQLQQQLATGFNGIAQGLARSYGDSSLATQISRMDKLDYFLDFDPESGIVNCQAGVSLRSLIEVLLPQGWFLPVTPGTQFVTLAGAIASDVHGKNHHLDGSFSQHIIDFDLMLADGSIKRCSKTENPELFKATCAGMGLTGFITRARLKMLRVGSAYINETTHKARNLAHVLELFEQAQSSTYSVAWIDCLAKGEQLGRSLLMLGEHNPSGSLALHSGKELNMPIDLPSFTLNSLSIKAFNELYYHRVRKSLSSRECYFQPYFYPLDAIHNWNRMYGKNGFTQYQFVIPKTAGLEGLTKILEAIADSGKGSFLAVLKAFGPGNDNYLSFPMDGYTLALDFKMTPDLPAFLDQLDELVLEYGGRLYLAKDARMSEKMFKASYPHWETFQQIRQQNGADKCFNSLQSQRLGL